MSKQLQSAGFTGTLSRATLAPTAGSASTFATTTTLQGVINGKFATAVSAVTGGTTPTTDYNSGAAITLVKNQARTVVWCYTSGGTVKCCAGPVVSQEGGLYINDAPQFPPIPDDVYPFGYMVIEAGNTTVGTWTFGSSNWNATGISVTTQDVCVLPARPEAP